MPMKHCLYIFISLILPMTTFAQDPVTKEITRVANSLVKQINSSPTIKSVSVTAFTDNNYQPIELGMFLADELVVSLLMNQNKKFTVQSRDHLEALINEAKLDQAGMLAPGNIPKLGKIKGIDLIIGAKITPHSNVIKLTYMAVELETGNFIGAERSELALIPSLDALLNGTNDLGDNSKVQPASSGNGFASTIQSGGLSITNLGCKIVNGEIICDFELMSISGDNTISIYVNKSTSQFHNGTSTVSQITLGKSKSRSRVGSVISTNQKTNMTVHIPAIGGKQKVINQLEFTCYSNSKGSFKIVIPDIPIN